jgi:DnaJ-class molecular chaperone
MGETFYTALGVTGDADQETIRRAYREQVKEVHPDVSDNPDASRRFKRLTTARDVLVDDGERRRYDELGHRTYVRRHVETPVWESAGEQGGQNRGRTSPSDRATGSTATTGSGAGAGTTATSSSRAGASSQSSRVDASSRSSRSGATAESGGRGGQGATPDGGYGSSWQQAPDAYMNTGTYVEETPGQTMGETLRRVGPWLIVHLVLITSAVSTGSFVLARASSDSSVSLPAALFLIVMLALVIVLSVLHLLTEAYT